MIMKFLFRKQKAMKAEKEEDGLSWGDVHDAVKEDEACAARCLAEDLAPGSHLVDTSALEAKCPGNTAAVALGHMRQCVRTAEAWMLASAFAEEGSWAVETARETGMALRAVVGAFERAREEEPVRAIVFTERGSYMV